MGEKPKHNPERKRRKKEKKEGKETLGMSIYYSATEKGERKEKNEDTFLELPEKGVAGVFDGLGGHYGGDEASGLARDMTKVLFETLDDPATVEKAKAQMKKVFMQIHERFLSKKKESLNEGWVFLDEVGSGETILDMQTTGVITRVMDIEGERHAIIGSVGDSRMYVLRGGDNPELEMVTLDDSSWINEFASSEEEEMDLQKEFGEIEKKSDLSSQKRLIFRRRHEIKQSLGGVKEKEGELVSQEISPNIYDVALGDEDIVLLTTDGIHDNLTTNEMQTIVTEAVEQGKDPAKELLNAARERSEDPSHYRHKDDDKAAVVVDWA